MDIEQLITILKTRIGISTTSLDDYLETVVNSIIKELEEENGISIDLENINQAMFIVDYSTWRIENKGEQNAMPEHLRQRLRNLFVHYGG